MNGLTAVNVEKVISKLIDFADTFEKAHAFGMAANVSELINEIEEMQRYNSTQPSRPDRVGDGCWYFSNMAWRRGILRAWVSGEDYAAIEDLNTKKITCSYNISFSDKAPE